MTTITTKTTKTTVTTMSHDYNNYNDSDLNLDFWRTNFFLQKAKKMTRTKAFFPVQDSSIDDLVTH